MDHCSTPPSLDDIKAIAEDALSALPETFRRHLKDIVFRVEEFPDETVMNDLALRSPFDLLGLYQGVDMARKSFADAAPEIDMIFLYRRPILDHWIDTDEDFSNLVRHVLIHEIGHHFGLSDDDMNAIEGRT